MIRFYRPSILKIEAKRGNKLNRDLNISLKNKDLKLEGSIMTMEYEFEIKYGDDTYIRLSGIILGQGNEKELEEFEKHWKETKKLKEELFVNLYNYLMINLFNKITEIADIIGLPAPVNLPLIRKEQIEKEEKQN